MNNIDIARANYPRVSQIISKQNDHELRSIPVNALVNASLRGTAIHGFCSRYLQNIFPNIIEGEEDYQPYCDRFMKWVDENIEKVISLDTRLYCDSMKFSGQYDAIVKLKNIEGHVLIDFKTSFKPSASWPVQLGAYSLLCTANTIPISHFYILHLSAVKEPQLIPYPNIYKYRNIFSYALWCYEYFVLNNSAKIEDYND
jgi:hypothetical protein